MTNDQMMRWTIIRLIWMRELRDQLHFPIDRNVRIKMKDCEIVAGAE